MARRGGTSHRRSSRRGSGDRLVGSAGAGDHAHLHGNEDPDVGRRPAARLGRSRAGREEAAPDPLHDGFVRAQRPPGRGLAVRQRLSRGPARRLRPELPVAGGRRPLRPRAGLLPRDRRVAGPVRHDRPAHAAGHPRGDPLDRPPALVERQARRDRRVGHRLRRLPHAAREGGQGRRHLHELRRHVPLLLPRRLAQRAVRGLPHGHARRLPRRALERPGPARRADDRERRRPEPPGLRRLLARALGARDAAQGPQARHVHERPLRHRRPLGRAAPDAGCALRLRHGAHVA